MVTFKTVYNYQQALPGGFNHLRRMYSSLQDPMSSAFTQPDNSSDEANERLARQLNVSSIPGI